MPVQQIGGPGFSICTSKFRINFFYSTNEDAHSIFNIGTNMTMVSAEMKINNKELTTTLLVLNSTNGYLTINTPNPGDIKLLIPKSIMSVISPAEYVHDMVALFDDGISRQLWFGNFLVQKGIT